MMKFKKHLFYIYFKCFIFLLPAASSLIYALSLHPDRHDRPPKMDFDIAAVILSLESTKQSKSLRCSDVVVPL